MTDVAQLGIRVDSAQALKAVTDLDRLAIAGAKAEAATDGISVASGRAAPAMGKMGGQSRMLAQQLSQVAQQSAATGNVMQAVAIQAADIGLAFGTIGTVVGMLATIALPTLISAFSGAGGAVETARAAVDGLDEAVSRYVEAAGAANLSTAELTERYGALATQAQTALQAMADVALVDAMNATDAAISAVLDTLTSTAEFASSEMLGMSESAIVLRDSFGMTYQQAANLRQALEDLSGAQGIEAQAQAATRVQEAMRAAYGSVSAMPAPLRDAYAQMAQIAERAASVEGATKAGAGWIAQMASSASGLAGYFASADSAAAGLASTLSAAASAAWSLAQGRAAAMQSVDTYQAGGLAAQYAQYGAGRAAGERAAREGGALYNPPGVGSGSGGGGGGGGGGGTDPYAGNLQSLIESLRTEREIEDEWYQESMTILQDRRAQEIMGKAEHDKAMIALHEEYARRIAEIDANSQSERLGYTADFFGAVASIAEAGGSRLAKVAATAAAVEGTVNAYRAALQAMADPTIPFWGKAAAYASVLAAGLKGVAAIRSAGGVGGGGAAVAAQGAAGGGQVGPQATLNIAGLGRDRSYTGAELEQIFDGILGVAKTRGLNMPVVAFV